MAPNPEVTLVVDPAIFPSGDPTLPHAPQPPQQTPTAEQLFNRLLSTIVRLNTPESLGNVTVTRNQKGDNPDNTTFTVTSPTIPTGISLELDGSGVPVAKPFITVNGKQRPIPANVPAPGVPKLLADLDVGLTERFSPF
jgi:hypothetical protein